jgi:hypothetical protein
MICAAGAVERFVLARSIRTFVNSCQYRNTIEYPEQNVANLEKLQAMSIEELRSELKRRERNQAVPTRIDDYYLGGKFCNVERLLPASDPLREFASAEIINILRDKQCEIYGPDDRMDILDVTPLDVLKVSESVVALFSSRDVTDNGNGTSTLKTYNFGATYGLCTREPFRNQPCGGIGTGFLLSEGAIATAGHCVTDATIADTMFVFGFRMISTQTPNGTINKSNIYRGKRILDKKIVPGGADWAIVELDRAVVGYAALKARKSGRIGDGESVYVLGHPAGLPLKYAGNAVVRDNSPESYFVANLDTYGGNSGSPVINATTHVVEGILVRGEHDFVKDGNCKVSLPCPNTGCSGEECTRTTEFADFVP